MLKRFKALLPKLPIILPVATIGMLLFSEMPDPISSLLSKSEEEKEEELNLEMASKKEEKDSPDGKGKNPEAKGDEGEGDGESAGGEKGKDKGSDKDENKGQEGLQGSQEGTENGAEDGSGKEPLSLDLGANEDSADGAGGSDDVAKAGVPEGQDALGDSGSVTGGSDGNREQGEEAGSVISGQGRDGEEKKEVQRKPSQGGPKYFAPAFRSLIGDIRSESFA